MMPVKEYLLRIMSVRTNIPQKTIEAVMNHQFEGVVEAMHNKDIYSIEVSGFGKFLFNTNKASKKIVTFSKKIEAYEKALLAPGLSDNRKAFIISKIAYLKSWIDAIKPKVNDHKSNSRGVEE